MEKYMCEIVLKGNNFLQSKTIACILTCTFLCFLQLDAKAFWGDPLQKESKKAAKQLKDEGWKVYGNKSIKESLDAHYKALAESNGNLIPIEGLAKASDINLAIKKSQYYAARQYASMKETQVEGTTHTHISNTSDESSSSHIKMESDFQSSTSQTVKSLVPSIIFYRTLSNGWVEVRSFFLVDVLK